MSINGILDLIELSPTGAVDTLSAEKLLAEREELVEALAEKDFASALTEAADAAYYAVKHLHWVANEMDLSVQALLDLAVAKYTVRYKTNSFVKDHHAEQNACMAVLV